MQNVGNINVGMATAAGVAGISLVGRSVNVLVGIDDRVTVAGVASSAILPRMLHVGRVSASGHGVTTRTGTLCSIDLVPNGMHTNRPKG